MARLFVLAHGAGAPSSSPWMQRYREALQRLGEVVSFDYDYASAGRRMPDRLPRLIERHHQVLRDALRPHHQSVILVGKSMGSRVGCHLSLRAHVDALVCLGYPLRGAGPRAPIRDQILRELRTPVLFIQGTRDALCPLDLLNAVRTQMEAPNQLFVVESGDHSLLCTRAYLRKVNQTQQQVEAQIIDRIDTFLRSLDSDPTVRTSLST